MKTGFITSTGRTGTDFFSLLFNKYIDNTWSLHEPSPAFRRRSYTMLGRKHTLYEKYYFKIPRVRRQKKHKAEWYIETNYHLSSCYNVIRDAFKDAIIIHIIRDGRDVVTSWLNKYRYITNTHLTPFHIPGHPDQKNWPAWNPLQKATWYWKTINNYAFEQEPDLWIKFEDIFSNNKTGIFNILDLFDNIDYDKNKINTLLDNKVNTTRIKFFPHYEEWPKHWKEQFWEIAEKDMKFFGYV